MYKTLLSLTIRLLHDIHSDPLRLMSQQSRDVTYCKIRAISQQSLNVTYCPIRAMSKQSRYDTMYCRDRGYLTTHVTPLPRLCHLSENAPRAFINYARTDQLEEMKRMILLAEERGDDAGKGEFTTESERSDCLLNRSEIFTVSFDNKSSFADTSCATQGQGLGSLTEVDAFIAISPCLYARTYDPCLATVRVFRSARLSADDRAYRSLVHLAVQLTDEINCGYTHVVIDVALCHVNLLRQLKNEGFHVIAIIPDNVYVNGVGACENCILIKRFQQQDRPVRSLKEVLEMLERVDPCKEFLENYPTMELPQLSVLPQRYNFSNGTEVIYRSMRKEEDEMLFKMMTNSIERGQGYCVNEYPSLDYFRKHRLATGPTAIMEDVLSNQIIGFAGSSDTSFSRGWKTASRSRLVLNPDYRGKRFGTEIVLLHACISRETGIIRGLENTFVLNSAVRAIYRHTIVPMNILGIIPNAGYLRAASRFGKDNFANMGAVGAVAGAWEDIMITDFKYGVAPSSVDFLTDRLKKRALETTSKI